MNIIYIFIILLSFLIIYLTIYLLNLVNSRQTKLLNIENYIEDYINKANNTYIMTLQKWQSIIKPIDNLIVQASTTDGMDGTTISSIGMCYHYVNIPNKEDIQLGSHESLVLCAVNETTDNRRRNNSLNRKSIINILKNNGISNIKINPDNYYKKLPEYKFIISPEGNGIDCHRHYEALLAGCIPIVENNDLIKNKYGKCPILYTTDYSEITKEYLEQVYLEMIDNIYDFSKLFLSYWDDNEQRLIKERGNFWCKKLVKKDWYK